jgi:predicted Rossmann fold nucleotide-binding protein DprA/Smf involved in DNA uptake
MTMQNRIKNSPNEALLLNLSDPCYPSGLRHISPDGAPPRLRVLGNPKILKNPLLGFFCSAKCPGQVILRVYDLARALRDSGIAVISGFHSSMEKECLDLLLRGDQPVVICPGRSIDDMRLPSVWRKPVSEHRLLLLSSFEHGERRATRALAEKRNQLVAAVADSILVAHANAGGKTEKLIMEQLALGKRVYTLDLKENSNLIGSGATPTSVEELERGAIIERN